MRTGTDLDSMRLWAAVQSPERCSFHKHEDGQYVVSMTRFEQDYLRIQNADELLGWVVKGFSLRMPNPGAGITAPSLIARSAIYRPVAL